MKIEEKTFNSSVIRAVSNSNYWEIANYTRTFIINDRVDDFKSFYSTGILMAYSINRADLIKKQRIRRKIMRL